MRKRFAIVGGILVLVILGIGGWQFWKAREPSFEGRKLSAWMDHHVASSAAHPPYGSEGWRRAHVAIQKIGTNGIPTLLRMISATDTDLRSQIARFVRSMRWIKRPYRLAPRLNDEAMYAFEILGTNAVGAVPALIEIYRKGNSPYSQMCAALALGHIGRGAESALPVLIGNFTHTNDQVRFYAVSAVISIGGDPTMVVPALRSMLDDSKAETRWNAIVGLGMFGRKAETAMPDLFRSRESIIQTGSVDLRKQVDRALWRIAPEKTAKAMVVEEGTPLIVNGVTTEALDLSLRGERRTLIRAGTSLPVSQQTWDSDPRGKIELYRGAKDRPTGEVFLGAWEVAGLPPKPEEVHAYVIVGVADGNIFICARDVNSDELLEVRRVE